MIKQLRKWGKTLLRSGRFLVRGNNLAKFFFLLLSVFLWFLIKLSREGYTAQIEVPVAYQKLPEGQRLVNEPPEHLVLNLRGKGFDMLRLRFRQMDPLPLDISEAEQIDTGSYQWETEAAREAILKMLGDAVVLTGISPSIIPIEFSPIESRRLPVKLQAEYQLPGFKSLREAPHLSPDSITVWGTRQELSGLDSIQTQKVVLDGKQDSLVKVLPLQLPPGEGLEFSHRETEMRVEFVRLTEGRLSVPVRMVNLPEGYQLRLIPEKVTVTYQVPIDQFSEVLPEDFELVADFRDLPAENRKQYLPVKMRSAPEMVSKVRLDPSRVEYLLSLQ